MTNRVEWIDLCKGVVMILTVYMHCGLANIPFLGQYVNIFFMPLFFFVSGLFMKPDKYRSLKELSYARWKTLYRPFLIFFIIVMPLAKIFTADSLTWTQYIVKIVEFGCGGYALWFLPVLALSEVVNYIIGWNLNKNLHLLPIYILAALGYLAYMYSLPAYWNIFFVLSSSLFYGVGFYMNRWLFMIDRGWSISRVICYSLFFLILGSLCLLLPKPEWFVNKIVSPFVYPVALFATIGVMLSCISFCRFECRFTDLLKRLLIYIGKNTIIVVAFHQITMQLLSLTGVNSGIIIRLLMWITLFVIAESINRICPQILGKNKQILSI